MSLREQLLHAIDALPNSRLAIVLRFVDSLSGQPTKTTARSFLAHLQTLNAWSGDDLQDCLEAVENSQGSARFDYGVNPFD
ncbi:hypothetical protein [Oscillatoria sp. FACHB-1406]|uniref:hypothetical protein n=1 Tax=Oscillatoria sp. FACHB-1406 TaxID=2692846 RepID=UPI0016866090|nr:hypothetical protein [Oscillatoria sp. FACHB-1406]MBD2577189.1 hypothetical protein [Oscillatoria sp. FACHB-1406]